MLEYLKLELCTNLSCDSDSWEIKENDGLYDINIRRRIRARIPSDEPEKPDQCSGADLTEWLEELEDIHLDEWEKHYTPFDVIYLDGKSWSLKYRYQGEKEVRITGENAYPGNWEKFIGVMKELDDIVEKNANI